MKLLIVHPGASTSTHDVWLGLTKALERRGHHLFHYRLDHRIDHADRFLELAYRRHKRAGGPMERPNAADVLYLAGQGVLERALRQQVDWVIVVSAMFVHPDWLILLQRAGLRTAVILTESPYDSEREIEILPYVDLAWTNELDSVSYLRQANANVEYLPHAFDPDRHNPKIDDPPDTPSHDVVFVGSAFEERVELLRSVDWSGIDLGLYGQWTALGSRNRLRQYVRDGPVDNEFAAALYRQAKIGLNLYRSSKGFGRHAPRISGASSLNPRAYELAACGVFTISEYRREIQDVMGGLVPTFSSPEHLETLVRKALNDEQWRRALARQLPETVARHTWDDRVREIERQLAGHLNSALAVV